MTFCLVHGSSQSPAGWHLLAQALTAAGHHSFTVDLPTDQPQWSATGYARRIAEACLHLSETKPIVVAHSTSGLFLPLVSQFAPVHRLVYLAAVIPLPGQSFLAQFKADPSMYHADFVGQNPTTDEALALRFMFHDCPAPLLPWALTTRRLMYAQAALTEVTPLQEFPPTPSTYISCRQDRTIHPLWWEQAARDRLQIHPILMETGHFPHVSQPEELAALLVRLNS